MWSYFSPRIQLRPRALHYRQEPELRSLRHRHLGLLPGLLQLRLRRPGLAKLLLAGLRLRVGRPGARLRLRHPSPHHAPQLLPAPWPPERGPVRQETQTLCAAQPTTEVTCTTPQLWPWVLIICQLVAISTMPLNIMKPKQEQKLLLMTLVTPSDQLLWHRN